MTQRWFAALAGVALAGAALSIGPALVAGQSTKLKFGMPTTPPNMIHITPWVAQEQGYFREEGLDVEIVTFEGGVYVIRNVVSGAIDAGGGAGASVAVSAAKKAGIKGVFGQAPRFGSTMTVRSLRAWRSISRALAAR